MSVFDPPVQLHPDMATDDLVAGIMRNFHNIPAGLNSNTIINIIESGGSTLSGQAQEVLVPNIVGDGLTDDADPINALLSEIELFTSVYTTVVVKSPIAGGSVYINTVINQKSNNVRLKFESPIIFGPNGYLRQEGELRESGNAKLPSSGHITSGDTSITLSTGSAADLGIQVGDQIVIRGNRNAYGNTINPKETNYVTAIAGDVLTLSEPMDNSYAYSYTNSYGSGNEWNTVFTRIYPVVGSAMSVGAARGASSIAVLDSSRFLVGDYVLVSDATHTWDPDPGELETTNYVHKEIAQVSEIVDATHIRINHALHHTYDTAKYAQVSVLDPIINSSIENVDATFTGGVGSGLSKYPVYTYYAAYCSVRNIKLRGTGPLAAAPWGNSWYKQGVRNSITYMCASENLVFDYPAVTDSGSGYGVTLYAATYCRVTNVWATATRHAVLLFNGSCGNIIDHVYAQDTGYSDLDCHGAECVDNLFTDCEIIGGTGKPMDSWNILTGPVFDPSPVKAALRVGNPSHTPGDHYNTFRNIKVTNYDGYAIEAIADCHDNLFENIDINGAQRILFLVPAAGTGRSAETLYLKNTYLRNITADGLTDTNGPFNIDGGASVTIQGVYVDGIHLKNQQYGYKASNVAGMILRRATFDRINFAASQYFASLTSVSVAWITNNEYINGQRFVSLTSCTSAVVANNLSGNQADAIFYKDNGGNTGTFFGYNNVFGFTPTYSTGGTGPTASQTFFLPADGGLVSSSIKLLDTGSGFYGSFSPGTLTAARTWTFPNSAGTVILTTATQTLTNKTLTTPIISTISNTGTLTLPTTTGTLALLADVDGVAWTAVDQGFLAQTFDVAVAGTTAAALATAGTLYVIKLKLEKARSITNIVIRLGTGGGTLTSGQCFAALYQGAGGSLLGTTADQAVAWATSGLKTMAISGGPVAAAAGYVYVALWFNGTTGPALKRGASDQTQINAGLTAANSRWGTADTGKTTTAPGTLGTISAAADSYWCALS